ncbi:hypothetical protein [Gilvimarinus sp. DA14]|uniref:hypothetical protein n=1 Tax=Gilvimarinus sp. DA14 TaxID=2956798 RepID=UPI0020B81C9B|nr:hypothetical protein [Gilvimarinus sp. DA14]UTF61204.1 hypothetical protein NHM04_05235 [Gilvimarinus sp. DA14]
MAVITLKGLLMDKGGHSVDRWKDQIVRQLQAADQTARNAVQDWNRFYGPECEYVTLCYSPRAGSHVKRFDVPEVRIGDLRWRVLAKGQDFGFSLHSFVRLTSGVRERVDNRAKVAAMMSCIQGESPRFAESMYSYDAVGMRLRVEIDSYLAIFKSLVAAQVWKDSVAGEVSPYSSGREILVRSSVDGYEV